MASQSSFEGSPTPVDHPSTPQPHGDDIPAKGDYSGSASPNNSTAVAMSSSALLYELTPPPSSQAPPPAAVNGAKKEAGSGSLTRPTPEQILNASNEELKDMLRAVLESNAKLEASLNEARMSVAHHKLQHTLLTIETDEVIKRMEVEQKLKHREVEVLSESVRDYEKSEYTQRLKEYSKTLEAENLTLCKQVARGKRAFSYQETQLELANERISQLVDRIRQNREHINYFRSPGGPLHCPSPKPGPTTPHQYRSTPKQTPTTGRSGRQMIGHSQESQSQGFNALVLASSVMSQENNSAPSTPVISRRPDPRTPGGHHRGAQSLSSIPNTPGSGRFQATHSTLLPSALSAEADARVAATLAAKLTSANLTRAVNQRHDRRRKSRDSTISASDHEEIARAATSFRQESEEIQESQASQSATDMLRADPRESFEVTASRDPTPTPATKLPVKQSKLLYGASKRKLEDKNDLEEDLSSPAKKIRTSAGTVEGIGLGIGFKSVN